VNALNRRGLPTGSKLKPEHDPELERRIAIVRAWKDATGRVGRPGTLTEEELARILPE
jgi:hypothetical protein